MQEETSKLRIERDSLAKEAVEIEKADSVMAQISSCLDSIALQEKMLIRIADSEGHEYTKPEILENIRMFKTILNKYQSQIATLQDSVARIPSMKRIIEHLSVQLNIRNAEIARLQDEIATNKADIKSLLERNAILTQEKNRVQMEKEMSDDVIEMQEELLNQGFYIIGTKKQLKEAEVLKGGNILKKKSVDFSNIREGKFETLNILEETEINVDGKSPKILSQMPHGSYHWNGTTLVIDNPKAFWGVTRYLIIQVN